MDKQAMGSAIAGGAIATAMIETLLDNQIITLDQARDMLQRALRTIGIYSGADGAYEASRIIQDLLGGRFSARGKTP